MQRVRRAHDAEAVRQVEARAESTTCDREHREAHVRERLATELSTPLEAAPHKDAPAAVPAEALPRLEGPRGAGDASPTGAASASSRALVEALVEKIDWFVRSGRPGLSLTLAGGFASEVTVERTGPGEIALRLRGRGGPPRPEELSRLREQLAARGLRVSALRVS